MKKILYTLIAILGFANVSLAQCGTIMVNSSTLQYPDTITNLPTAIKYNSYITTIQLYCTGQFGDLNLNSITGLPSGFTYSTYPTSGVINSNNSGCLIIQSSNVSAAIGTYSIVINATVIVLGMPFTVQILGYKIKIFNPPPLLISTIITNETCKDKLNGSIISTATGGVSPYQYSINNGTYQTSNTFSNLSPGVYLSKVKDSLNVVTQHYDTIKAGSDISVGNMVGSTLVAPNAISNYVIGQQIGVNYLWNVTNGIIANGQGTNLTQVIWSASAGIGNVKVKVTNSTGCSDSTTLNVTIGSTNISTIGQALLCTVYPNPANNELIISTNQKLNGAHVIITDMIGRKMLEENVTNASNEHTVLVSELKSGAYILSIQKEGETSRIKFVKE